MIRALFENYDTVKVYGLHQWDYGQVLRIEGLKLPTAIEVHFSLQETSGEAVTRIGVTKDSVTDVVIPDSMLENNATTQDYTIYAYIYLADQTSGQTIKKITMPVTARPRPEIWDTPEDADLFREAIAAVNSSANRAEKAAESIEGYVEGAKADIDEYVAGKESELRGEPGEPGEPGQPGTTPHIGDNNHWYIGDTDTGVDARGTDGITPHIGDNGHWYIGDTDTGVDARGMDGTTPHIGDNGHWWIGDVDTGVVAGGGGGGAVEDVQVNGDSIVGNDGVANIPLANDTQYGVVKVPASPTKTNSGGIYLKNNVPTINTNMKYGVYYSDGYGALRIVDADTTDINNKRNVADNYSVIVPHNLDYAVKAAMTDGIGAAWTADEQAAARERMGVYSADNWVKLIDIELTEEAEIQCLNAFEPVYSKFCFKAVRNQTTNPETRNTQVQLKRNTETMVLSHQSFSSNKTKCSTRGHLELYKFSDDPKKYYRCLGVYTAGESENFDTLDPQGSATYMYGYALSDLPNGIVVTGVHGVGTRLVLWGCR